MCALFTPFVCAALNQRVAIVELLVKEGAAIDAKDGDGNGALWHAACDRCFPHLHSTGWRRKVDCAKTIFKKTKRNE